ncbi:phosphotransferase [Demequina sediminicola]|uniref:phosphotransferase n=1 Tax=Demequina sediminicola TaxID=1095026 RepID=UPI0007813604|nr:phosphotransferase [Demequina sediminicola]
MTLMAVPAAEVVIDDALVRSLIADQHPDLASLALGERTEGWDNVTYRLGSSLAVRLPRRELAAPLADNEIEWLPRVSAHWTFPAPVPQRVGKPSGDYPWRWSIVPWISGALAFTKPLSVEGAQDLGWALAQIHTPAPADAPRNPFRSVPLSERAETFGARLHRIEPQLEDGGARLREAFAAGAQTAPGPVTWTHLDLHGGNILTQGGRLAGILDWGDAGVGSPATDLGQASVAVGREHVAPLLDAYAGAATDSAARFIASAAGRLQVRSEAVNFAVTLANIDDAQYSEPGLRALRSFDQRRTHPLG